MNVRQVTFDADPAIAKEVRRLIIDAVSNVPENTPLLLSGGVDSGSLLAASCELGRKPDCFTFHLEGYESKDAQIARKLAAHFGVSLTLVAIPRDLDVTVSDIRTLLHLGVLPLKTHIQCSQPFIYLADAIREQGYERAISGMAADSVWGSSRYAMIALSRSDEEFQEYRRKEMARYHLPSPTGISDQAVALTAASRGVELIDPYLDQDFLEYAMSLPGREIHFPKFKKIVGKAFEDLWGIPGLWRRFSGLQMNSGLREHHDALLATPLNIKQWEIVSPIYRAMARGEV